MKKNIALLLLLTLLFTACNSGGDEPAASSNNDDNANQVDDHHADDHDDEHMEGVDDHEHQDNHDRIDNPNGVAITITSPSNGDTFAAGNSIKVEVEIDNFTLVEEGHWHVYIDGASFGMVTGLAENTSINGVEPGEHLLEVYLANTAHEEFKVGDSIMITVEQ